MQIAIYLHIYHSLESHINIIWITHKHLYSRCVSTLTYVFSLQNPTQNCHPAQLRAYALAKARQASWQPVRDITLLLDISGQTDVTGHLVWRCTIPSSTIVLSGKRAPDKQTGDPKGPEKNPNPKPTLPKWPLSRRPTRNKPLRGDRDLPPPYPTTACETHPQQSYDTWNDKIRYIHNKYMYIIKQIIIGNSRCRCRTRPV